MNPELLWVVVALTTANKYYCCCLPLLFVKILIRVYQSDIFLFIENYEDSIFPFKDYNIISTSQFYNHTKRFSQKARVEGRILKEF